MKRSTKVLLALLGGATVGGIVIAARMGKSSTPPVPIDPASLPPEILGAALELGFETYGWYSYPQPKHTVVEGKQSRPAKMWIRVDKGPTEEGTVLDDLPWRWTIFVEAFPPDAPEGKVPIATGTKSWTDLGALYRIDALAQYADDDMAQMVARAAAEQIDTMYSEAS